MPGEKKTYKTFPKIHYLSCAFLIIGSHSQNQKKKERNKTIKRNIYATKRKIYVITNSKIHTYHVSLHIF